MEITSFGSPLVEEAYSQLKAYMFGIILPPSKDYVMEHGQSSRQAFDHVQVCHLFFNVY